MTDGPSTDMKKFHEVVKSSRNIIAIAGAGLSAASGDSERLTAPPLSVPFTTLYF